jgi:hypothetical protein
VLIHEWTNFIRVTFGTDRISAWQRPYLAKRRRSMHIVAITALDQALVHSMVIWPPKISSGGGVASIAEIGLRLDEQMFGFFGMVRRVAVEAPNVIAGVWRSRKVSLFVLLPVAAQTARVGVLSRNRREVDDP